MNDEEKKVLHITLHWDTLIERSIASFIGGLLAGGTLYFLIQVF